MKDILSPYIRVTDIGKNIFNLFLEDEVVLDLTNIRDRNIVFLISMLFRDTFSLNNALDFISVGLNQKKRLFFYTTVDTDSRGCIFSYSDKSYIQSHYPNRTFIDANSCIEVLKIPSKTELVEIHSNKEKDKYKWKLTLS